MQPESPPPVGQAVARPLWSAVLRAIREARGVTQEGWAARFGVSETTVRRWEGGRAVPNEEVEQALSVYCTERRLFRVYDHEPLHGLNLTSELLGRLLAEARLASAPQAPTPPLAPPAPGQTLPAALTSLIGRTQDIARVGRHLSTARLVTLTGPGGVGKSRLALAAAAAAGADFPDGVYLVTLAALTNHRQVAAAVAQALGVRDFSDQPLVESIKAHVGQRTVLIVLDNFEHLLAAAGVVADLLTACPALRILTTSRTPLHVGGEQQFLVRPLAVPDLDQLPPIQELGAYPAVELFIARAQAVDPDFDLTAQNAAAIVQICHRLDGLPLAIELAAARVNVLSVPELAARLERRLPLLTGGNRDLPARHQTLYDTIRWSYDLLDAREQSAFRSLSVFAGGCTLAAAEAVCNAPGDGLLDVLGALVDKSLLQRIYGSDGEIRFRMLETVREFGLDQLEQAHEAARMRATQLQWMREMARPALQGFPGTDPVTWLRHAGAEIENVRVALAWALTEPSAAYDGLVLAGALQPLWAQGHVREGCEWLDRFLARDVGAGTPARAGALLTAAQLTIYRSGFRAARGLIEECLVLSRALGRRGMLVQALSLSATDYRADLDLARPAAEEAAALARELGEPGLLLRALYTLGRTALAQGDLPFAHDTLIEAVAWGQRSGIHYMTAAPLRELGIEAYRAGQHAEAREYLEHSVALLRGVGNEEMLPESLASLGRVALAQGKPDEAWLHFTENVRIASGLGCVVDVPITVSGIAAVCLAEGAVEEAARWFGAADAFGEMVGVPMGELYVGEHQAALAMLRERLDEEKRALRWAEGRSLSLAQLAGQLPAEVPHA